MPSNFTPVELSQLTLRAGGRLLLHQATVCFQPGSLNLIVGASGVGKSLLLRLIAGLADEDAAQIEVRGQVYVGKHQMLTSQIAAPARSGHVRPTGSESHNSAGEDGHLVASAKEQFVGNEDGQPAGNEKRRVAGPEPGRHAAMATPPSVGVVFQHYALFDELTPLENVRFAADHRRGRHQDAQSKPEDLLSELGVPANRRTAHLSGGQRQRLAIARSLAFQPDVLLYDEPTSGLDLVTASQVARLIQRMHRAHRQTTLVVTHDFEALAPVADAVYLLDPHTHSLRLLDRSEWCRLAELIRPPGTEPESPSQRETLASAAESETDVAPGEGQAQSDARRATVAGGRPARHQQQPAPTSRAGTRLAELAALLTGTGFWAERLLQVPLRLLPRWPSPRWGLRFAMHYLWLAASPAAWIYVALAGVIVGFVATYYTFRFLPYRGYSEPLIIENLLEALGFALYRILVPVLVTVLLAARTGAAMAADVGTKSYSQQTDALRTFGVHADRYLGTGVLYALLLTTPLLTWAAFWTARLTSLAVFAATHPQFGPHFWELHFEAVLATPGRLWYHGSGWLAAKLLVCALGIGVIAYEHGVRPKHSAAEVSLATTRTVLWATLYVLVVHFVFAFYEFD